MSEKILILPKEDAEFIYPYEIDYNFKGTISAWENNKLIGFIFHNDELRPIQLYQAVLKASTHLRNNSLMIMA